jgi:CRP/FNR family transcriptional regulator, cyclic AMP receptor protein
MNNRRSRELLRKIPLFHDCSDNELERIDEILIHRSFAERSIIFMQGEPLEYIYFIVSGKVKIYRTDEQGREQIVNLLEPGDFFPHIGFFRKAEYPAHSVMIEKGVLLALPTARLRNLLEKNPDICINLMAVMESKIIDLQERLEEVVLHDTFSRLVLLLIRLSRLHGVPDGERIRINVPLTNQELANMIGTRRETVNRAINQLKKAGAVETTTDHYLLINCDRLEKQLHV